MTLETGIARRGQPGRTVFAAVLMSVLAYSSTVFATGPLGGTQKAGSDSTDSKVAKDLKAQSKKGFPLNTEAVSDNISVEAVLLPASVCKKVFGKEIADQYAAVELTISNRSQDQSLIVHSIFIDYSQWALSGSQFLAPPGAKVAGANPTLPWQAETLPNQISSVEYRVARGELLDAQPWTWRNITMRALQLAGAVGSAYSFSIGEQGIIRGISAFSGQVVPGAETFWPDGTVGQMNRISDVGFQTNKVISKGSSDIVVAFFPLDRFLTPGLKKLFIKSPALFFSPYALMFDPEGKKEMKQFLAPTLQAMGVNADTFLPELAKSYLTEYVQGLDSSCDCGSSTDNAGCTKKLNMPDTNCTSSNSSATTNVMKFLSHASLNTVRVIVGGAMAVDVDRIPATIASVDMNEGNDKAPTWKTGKHSGVIQGTFLGNGVPSITEPAAFAKTDFTVDQNSTDKTLHFSMTLVSDVSSNTNLTFVVTKTDKDGNKVVSTPFTLPVVFAAPALSNAIVKGKALTITGSKLSDTSKVLLFSDTTKTAPDVTLGSETPSALSVKDQAEASVDLSRTNDLAAGCWMVKLEMTDGSQSNGVLFPQPDNSKACEGKHPSQ